MPYPVSIDVQPEIEHRNRLTVALRLLLAIPHLILVGGIGFAFTSDDGRGVGGEYGLLGAVAAFLAVVSWFTLLIAGTQIEGIRQFTLFFRRPPRSSGDDERPPVSEDVRPPVERGVRH